MGFLLRQAGKDGGSWLLTGKLSALPGISIEKSIVSPKYDEPRSPVLVQIDWPPHLADKGLAVVACLRHEGFTYQPSLHWREIHDGDRENTIGNYHLLCGPGADRVARIQRNSLGLWQLSGPMPVPVYSPVSTPAQGVEPYKLDQIYMDLALQDPASTSRSVELLHGRNQLQKVAIVRHLKKLPEANHAERCELLAYASWSGLSSEQVFALGRAPVAPVSPLGMSETFMLRDYQCITPGSSPPTFEAKKDQPNVWIIRLPEELSREVTEKLKAKTKK